MLTHTPRRSIDWKLPHSVIAILSSSACCLCARDSEMVDLKPLFSLRAKTVEEIVQDGSKN